MVNYLRIFCLNLAVIAGPLLELQGETKRFKWTELHEESFKQCKKIIQSNRVLKSINHESGEPRYLITNASQSGCAGWIGQYDSTEKIRPAEFYSRKFNPTEFHWPTIQKELFASYNSIKYFQNVLSGHFFVVLTDYSLLLNFMSQRQDSAIRQRWQEFMMIFNFIIEHIKGKENIIADALSRSGQDGEIKDTRPHLPEDQTKPPPRFITTNHFTLYTPNIYNSYNMPSHKSQLIRDYILGSSIRPHRQTVNTWAPITDQPDDLYLVWTGATTTIAQAQQEVAQRSGNQNAPNFQVVINKRPSNPEPEEPASEWEQNQQDWQMGEVQPQEVEDLEDWERVSSNNEDMEGRIARTPSRVEKEWNATLGGTLRIRNNDERRYSDEITQDLKYRHFGKQSVIPTISYLYLCLFLTLMSFLQNYNCIMT